VCACVRAYKRACDNVNGNPRVKSAPFAEGWNDVSKVDTDPKKIQQTLLSTSLELLGLKPLTPY